MLGNYFKQTTSADDIFRCSFLGALRVKGFLFIILAKLPKNYDPDVIPDAERWLPRRERSYYRGKRKDKKRDIGKKFLMNLYCDVLSTILTHLAYRVNGK